MRLIVFKLVLMGGCIILLSFYNSHLLIHLVLWVVALKLDGRLLPFASTLWCNDKFPMKSFCRRPFLIMHFIIFITFVYAWWIVFMCWRGSPQRKSCHVHLHSKANYLYAHLQGEPFATYEDNALILKLSHTFIPIENFNQFVINHQNGEIVSASSATLSDFGVLKTYRLWD